MALGSRLCEECKSRYREPPVVTVTGRKVCPQCARDRFDAAATAVLRGGGVGGAVATHGWLKRVRALRTGEYRKRS